MIKIRTIIADITAGGDVEAIIAEAHALREKAKAQEVHFTINQVDLTATADSTPETVYAQYAKHVIQANGLNIVK